MTTSTAAIDIPVQLLGKSRFEIADVLRSSVDEIARTLRILRLSRSTFGRMLLRTFWHGDAGGSIGTVHYVNLSDYCDEYAIIRADEVGVVVSILRNEWDGISPRCREDTVKLSEVRLTLPEAEALADMLDVR